MYNFHQIYPKNLYCIPKIHILSIISTNFRLNYLAEILKLHCLQEYVGVLNFLVYRT